ncbi:TIGR03364 family FAD-dependent oxidoreductase [Rapidithrix thailandica]|uniref:TIGR03364 family FAD-dependent oxidoreductase n=1 Tax=Rapidithrix thailandica TaxID=413964 RepID=A0AAW9SCQ6_9BACT
MDKQVDIAIVGGGIVGLAHALAAAKRGYKVALFEKNTFAAGASIRNFGMVWSIGQSPGKSYELALKSRNIWLELSQKAGFWHKPNGSLFLAYQQDEKKVLEEFVDTTAEYGYQACQILSPSEIKEISPAAKTEGLYGGMFSPTEVTINSREAIQRITYYLSSVYGVAIHTGKAVCRIDSSKLYTGNEIWQADHIYVCNGSDFEILYPEFFEKSGIVKCKLQMMKTVAQASNWQLGPSLASGLTFRHYKSFSHCASIQQLIDRFASESPIFDQYGIHVLVGQNNHGEVLIGDSHQYTNDLNPFDQEEINRLILEYLSKFAHIPRLQIQERWHGVYAKSQDKDYTVYQPEDHVTVVAGIGGGGMTLSFALAEENLAKL